MSVALAERDFMAKKLGRPKTERDDVTVKLDRTLAGMAKATATAKGMTLGEYLSELTGTPIKRDYAKYMSELSK